MKHLIAIILMTVATIGNCQSNVTLKDPNSDLTSIVTLIKTKTKDVYKMKISLSNGSDSFRQQLTPVELFSFEDGQSGGIKDKLNRNFKFQDINADNRTDIIITNYISGFEIQGIKVADKSSIWLTTKSDYLTYNKSFSTRISGNPFETDSKNKTIRVFLQSSFASSYGYELYKIENQKLNLIDGIFICVAGIGTNDLEKRQVIFTKLVNGKKTETKKILDGTELEKLETENKFKPSEE